MPQTEHVAVASLLIDPQPEGAKKQQLFPGLVQLLFFCLHPFLDLLYLGF